MKNIQKNLGFTLVEIFVVIVILGILTGLSVFGYRGWQQNIAQREVKSDLQMAASAMENAKNFSDGYPTSIPGEYKASDRVDLAYIGGNAGAYCIQANANSITSVVYHIDSSISKEPRSGSCGSSYALATPVASVGTPTTSSLTVTWASVPGATSYTVRYGNSSPSTIATSCGATSCTVGGLATGTTYQFTVTASSAYNSKTSATVSGTTDSPGQSWVARTAAEPNQWSSITYGNGVFVTVAESGTNRVMTSPDGITWTARSASAQNMWKSVTFGNGLFVAVSQDGTNRVMTSPNGITWTARSAPVNLWQRVGFGNGLFIAFGSSDPRVMTSPDGINWTSRNAAEANTWNRVAYGAGLFVAVGSSGTNRVMTSPDGITWTARATPVARQWSAVTYGGGLFVAVANDSTTNTTTSIMTSPDGINWTSRATPVGRQWQDVTYGNGTFVALAFNTGDRALTSPNGITWTERSLPQTSQWYGLAFGNNRFVGIANFGTSQVITSP